MIEIEIHEPALTEDNLGLKTWASSYVLARKWHALKEGLRACCLARRESLQILELGAGTGLVGMAAAAVLGANVLLTDLPDIVPNLERNARSNAQVVSAGGGSVDVGILDWSNPADVLLSRQTHQDEVVHAPRNSLSVPLIVAADPIYSSEHPRLLVQAIAHHLSQRVDARVVIEMPIREAFAAERADFSRRMLGIGLMLVAEDTEIGYDDWSEGSCEELSEVECWMTTWAWKDD